MVRVATELRETLASILQAGPPDSPVLRRLIDSYRDIARELGQQHDVEHTLRDIMPQVRGGAPYPHAGATPARHPSHQMPSGQAPRNSPPL